MRLTESKIMIYKSLKEGNLRNHGELIIRKINQLKSSFNQLIEKTLRIKGNPYFRRKI